MRPFCRVLAILFAGSAVVQCNNKDDMFSLALKSENNILNQEDILMMLHLRDHGFSVQPSISLVNH